MLNEQSGSSGTKTLKRFRTTSCAHMEMERRAKAYPSVLLGAAPPP
jgi:hypothetical protein